jgi:hypothetical protein
LANTGTRIGKNAPSLDVEVHHFIGGILAMKSKECGLILGLLMAAVPTVASSFDWTACSKEIQQYCKDSKGDEAFYSCLEKIDHQKKLSKACDKAHDKYEKDSGKDDDDD